jgi:hypothetical protein
MRTIDAHATMSGMELPEFVDASDMDASAMEAFTDGTDAERIAYCLERFGKAGELIGDSSEGWRKRLCLAVGQIIPTSNLLPPDLQRAHGDIIQRAYNIHQPGHLRVPHANRGRKEMLDTIDQLGEDEGRKLMADVVALGARLKAVANRHD